MCTLALLTLLLYLLEMYTDSDQSFHQVFEHFRMEASAVFSLFSSTSPHWTLTFLSLFGNCLERILNAFSDMLFVMTVFMFRDLVKSFRDALFSEGRTAIQVKCDFHNFNKSKNYIFYFILGNQALSMVEGLDWEDK